MMKKFAVAAAGAALLLAVAAPVFAEHSNEDQTPVTSFSVNNADVSVDNHIVTSANSGFNLTGGGVSVDSFGGGHGDDQHAGGNISTGSYVSAGANLTNQVNFTSLNLAGCGCFDNISVSNHDAEVNNFVFTFANSGFNKAGNGDVSTGSYVSASAVVLNTVNTTILSH